MLELILTRPFEKPLIEKAQGLRFLVLDEMHTYRGRQGADVALLVRLVQVCEMTYYTISRDETKVRKGQSLLPDAH